MVINHSVPVSDEELCDPLLHHPFSGLCATQPDILVCHAIARGHSTNVHVAYRLGNILSSASTSHNILVATFRLCCVSIGLDPDAYGRELEMKLSTKFKAIELLKSCQNVFDTQPH